MRFLLYLGLSVALLCSMVIADHQGEGKHHDGHEKKGDHKHNNHQHGEQMLACHKIAWNNALFAYDLFAKLEAEHPKDNIVLSPISISTALAFLSTGAKAKTHDQIIEGIGFNGSRLREEDMHNGFQHLMEMLNDDDRELHLDSGNALFLSEAWKIQEEFLGKAKNYQSEAFTVDFQKDEEVKNQINSYVEKKTNGKITDVLSSVDKNAALILLNVIYFRGKWEKPFDPEFTKEEDFHVDGNHTVKVPFMSKTGYFKAAFFDEATVLSVPYRGNASALFVLPNQGKEKEVKENLRDIVKKWKENFQTRLLDFRVPRYSFASSFDLKEVLQKFGIVDLFSDSADLSGISGAPNLKVSKIIHKANINVDEKGTEAAGATVVEAIPMMLPPLVKLDHPFYYFVYDHSTKTILFMGQVVNPANS